MGILFALLTALTLGLANIILKKSFKDFSPAISYFFYSLFAFVLWSALAFYFGIQWNSILLGLFVGAISAICGNLIYIFVISRGELSITSTILSGFSLFTILFSTLFNHETITPVIGVCLALAIGGTLIVAFPEKGKFHSQDLNRLDGILWALFAAMSIGASDTLSKWYIDKSSVGSILFFTACTQVVISIVYMKVMKEKLSQFSSIFKHLKEYSLSLTGSLLIACSTMCLYIAFNFEDASIASPIIASYPVLTTVLAYFFLKEKISIKNWVGLICLFISLIGIGFIG